MQIELSDDLKHLLESKAAANGMSVSTYANVLMNEQLAEGSVGETKREEAVDALLQHMKTSHSSSGRDGRSWREFIHEGHSH